MKIKLLLFAGLREQFQTSQMDLEVLPGTPVGSIGESLSKKGAHGGWGHSFLYAVNHRHVKSNHLLQEGDEVALIPPMAGG